MTVTTVIVHNRGEFAAPTASRRKAAKISELRAAVDRLAEALSDGDEEELVAEFKEMRRLTPTF